ncbi:MAG: uracil-DNA glycosylase [Solirubrobacteraceae bacterium]
MTGELCAHEERVTRCTRCPRLVQWRERVARERRAAFRDEEYWGRPVPGFGDPEARLLVFGLAPAAHGGNRTGRVFTGDRSGDFLFAAMWRTGLASSPRSISRDDGLRLHGAWVTAAVRCAPPANKPTGQELANCLPWTARELTLLPRIAAVICLGAFAWNAALRLLSERGGSSNRGTRRSARPRFGHGAVAESGGVAVIGSYHPSQQNTFTGRLTEEMLDSALLRARELAGLGAPPAR